MSDGWQVGDLALCVDAREHPWLGPPPVVEGAAYRVAEVLPCAPCAVDPNWNGPGLVIAGLDCGPCGTACERFRKIRPDEHEPCEEEFVTLLKRNRVSA